MKRRPAVLNASLYVIGALGTIMPVATGAADIIARDWGVGQRVSWDVGCTISEIGIVAMVIALSFTSLELLAKVACISIAILASLGLFVALVLADFIFHGFGAGMF
jgi:hypothetical protein